MIRLVFFDLEGTLFEKQRVQLRAGDPAHHHSLWSRLVHELGPAALEDDARMIAKWDAGAYGSYLEWVDESLQSFRRHGLTRKRFDETLRSIAYNPGVPETVRALHERGIRTAIVSGGFMAQARRALRDLRIAHAYAAVDLLWDEDGSILHWNTFPSDYEGKVDFVRLLMREYGLRTEECGFVGDGRNDVFIAREVGTSFAYQAHAALRAAATHAIDDFEAIVRLLP